MSPRRSVHSNAASCVLSATGWASALSTHGLVCAMQSITVPATLDSLEPVSTFITSVTSQVGLDDHAAWQVQLAVDEAVTNIIQHGYNEVEQGKIDLSWQLEHNELVITIRDKGRQFNPSDVPEPDIHSPLEERQAGGLGIFLMNKLMDSVRYTFHSEEGNVLVMTKRTRQDQDPVGVFTLSGRLDAVTTNQALERARAAIGMGTRHVLLEFSGVTFMSSSGLRALLLLRKDLLANGGELRLCGLQPQVYEVFVLTGFTQVFAIHPSRQEALAAFGTG